jgi:hypothetical protein
LISASDVPSSWEAWGERLEARGLIFLASCLLPRTSRLIGVAHFSPVAFLTVKLNAPVENRQGHAAKAEIEVKLLPLAPPLSAGSGWNVTCEI